MSWTSHFDNRQLVVDLNSVAELKIPREFYRMTSGPRPCSYLGAEQATMIYRLYTGLSPAELEELIRRGWRRFSTAVFRPTCQKCQECLSLRVPVQSFEPSKSQRRVLRRNSHIKAVLQPPQVTDEHIQLYNAWHANREDARDWEANATSLEDYATNFLSGSFSSLHEMRYYEGDRLWGVGLIEVLPRSTSSIFFYYDPAWSSLSPGTYSALCELQLARQLGLDYVYFGYWVAQCPSLAYKNRFQPYELLRGLPADHEEPQWIQQTPAGE